MATGPEHYREAERLLAESRTVLRPNDEGPCEADRMIAEAQVHATLARVAVDALCQRLADSDDPSGHPSQEHYDEWVQVVEIGTEPDITTKES